ncbi:DH domain-containing protein [Entamoeba marina]
MQHDLIIWFNTVSNANISSIQELSDGVLVVKLLKTLTLSDTPYNNNPKICFQKVENFSIAFGIIQKHFSHSCSHDTKKMVNEDEHEIQQFLSVIKVLIGNKETSFNQKISLNPHPNVKRNKRQSFDVPLQTTYKESIKQTESKDNAILKPKIIIPNHQPISISDSSEQTNGESATFSRKSLQEIDEYELKTNNSQYQERRQSIVSHGNPFGLELEKLINKRLSINETNTYGKDKKISTTPSLHRSKTAVIDNNKFTRSPKIETVQKIPSQKKQNKFQIEVTGTNEQFQAVSKNTSTTIEQQKGKLFKRKSALILLDNRNELQIKQNSIDWQNKDYSYVNISDVITIQKVIQTFYVRKTLKMLRKKIKERKRAIMEILSNEEKFLGLMNQLADFLLFLNEHSTCKTFSLAWSFLKEIIDCTSTLYQSLYIVIVENNKVYGDGIAQCFIQHFIPFECYSHFINMYHRLNNDFEEIILKEELHSNIMEYVHILQIHQQTNMNDLSSAPFQHLMRYHIHLNRIIDSLYQNNPLTKELLQADTIVSDVIFKVDNQHKKYSNSMEINTIIPQLCYPINKTLFGRDLVALKQVEITRVKSRDISKRKYKQKYKKYLAFIITDAIILISNKELATKQVPTLEQLMEFKKNSC